MYFETAHKKMAAKKKPVKKIPAKKALTKKIMTKAKTEKRIAKKLPAKKIVKIKVDKKMGRPWLASKRLNEIASPKRVEWEIAAPMKAFFLSHRRRY